MFRKFVRRNVIQWPQKVATKADRIFHIFSLFWLAVCVCMFVWIFVSFAGFYSQCTILVCFFSQQFAFHPARIYEHCHSDIFQPVGHTHTFTNITCFHSLCHHHHRRMHGLQHSNSKSAWNRNTYAFRTYERPCVTIMIIVQLQLSLEAAVCSKRIIIKIIEKKETDKWERTEECAGWERKKRGTGWRCCCAALRTNWRIYKIVSGSAQCMLLYALVTDAYMQRFSLLAVFSPPFTKPTKCTEKNASHGISFSLWPPLSLSGAFVVVAVVIVEKSSVQQPLNMQQTKFNQTARWWIKRTVPTMWLMH